MMRPFCHVAAALLLTVALLAGPAQAQQQWNQDPRQFQPQFQPQYQQQQQQQMYPSQGFGSRCITQVGLCSLNQPGPLGYGCACLFQFGPAQGQIIP